MFRTKNLIAATLTTIATTTTLAMAASFTPFNATYTLDIDGKSGTATRTLTQSGNSFTYKVSARAIGIATANQSTTFSLSGNKVIPINSSTSYKIANIGNTHTIKFNNGQAVSTYKGKTKTLATPNGAYDDLSLEMQIRQELLNGKFSGSYVLVKKTDTEVTKFKKAGNAKITTPAGTYDTVRIDRIHNDKGRATSFWLAPSLDYLPVKVSQTNDGKTITMNLSKLK